MRIDYRTRYLRLLPRLTRAESHVIDLTALLTRRGGHDASRPEVLDAILYFKRREGDRLS